jgi:D-alanyl-D-alanine carboxypeptidase/D-alanyl-D-alanine-endopeptidase (penicillin-binding protein 4)
MGRLLPLPLLLLLLGGARPQDPAALPLEEQIDALVKGFKLRTGRLGLVVHSLKRNAVVYAHQEREPLRLASNTKLLTTAAALDRLGADFRFRTSVGVAGADLHVFGGGDPNLSGRFHEDDPTAILRRWAEALKAAGIGRVGNLVLHTGIFDGLRRHPGWKEYDPWVWWNAPFGPLSLNDNCLDLKVEPGREGQPVAARLVPDVPLFTLVNQARSAARPKKPLHVSRQAGSTVVALRGETGARATYWVAVDDPTLFFGAALTRTLESAGIEVTGSVEESDLPLERVSGYRELASWESGLAATLEVCNKSSQNFYAEMLLRTLGWKRRGIGSTGTGIAEVEAFLQEAGIVGVRLADGSGLTKENLSCAGDLVRLLLHMLRHKDAAVFLRSLAVNGEPEGTLRRRLTAPELKGRVRAKTGHVAGVSTLSGYVSAAGGDTFVFSVLVNTDGGISASAGDLLQNRLCELLARQ